MPNSEITFCSDIARKNGVPLIGSATRGDLWFLVEYSGRYESKAVESSTIPDQVIGYLKEHQNPGIKARILLIRQTDSHHREGLHFFIGQTDPQNPKLYEYQIEDYTNILDIDLTALAAGQPGDPDHLREKPLFIICTNGRRDFCCARYGPKIYEAMADELGDSVWQSSHIGGHNRAPNTLFFPHGVNYGRTTPEEILLLARQYQSGRLGLEHYRGQVCFDPHVQAAEHFWRQSTGVLELPGMVVVSIDDLGENQWKITIQGTDGANQHAIGVQRYDSDHQIQITCTGGKLRSISTFHRVS